jgi:hypothetical protein
MTNPFEILDSRLSTIEKLLTELNLQRSIPKALPEKEEAEILTAKQASEFLNLAIPTIYSLVSRRALISYKRAKKLYFKKTELAQWIQSGRRSSMSELQNKAKTFNPRQK